MDDLGVPPFLETPKWLKHIPNQQNMNRRRLKIQAFLFGDFASPALLVDTGCVCHSIWCLVGWIPRFGSSKWDCRGSRFTTRGLPVLHWWPRERQARRGRQLCDYIVAWYCYLGYWNKAFITQAWVIIDDSIEKYRYHNLFIFYHFSVAAKTRTDFWVGVEFRHPMRNPPK